MQGPDAVASASRVVKEPPRVVTNQTDGEYEERLIAEGKMVCVAGVHCKIPYSVKVVVPDTLKALGDIEGCVTSVLEKTEKTFSHFNEDSEVSRFNNLGAGVPYAVSDDMASLLAKVQKVFTATRGAFDPGVLPLEQLGESEISEEVLKERSQYSTWASYVYDEEKRTLTKPHNDARLDLCGIAKGHAIDCIAEGLAALGIVSAFVDWGGDVKVLGLHPSGRKWQVVVNAPPSVEDAKAGVEEYAHQPVAVIKLKPGEAMATSGDYVQPLHKKHSHIIDSRKRKFIEISTTDISLACVVSSTCALADAFATATLSVRDVAQGKKLLASLSGPDLRSDRVKDHLMVAREGLRILRKFIPGEEDPEAREERLKCHNPGSVVVVGSGLAGLCAAVSAAECGSKVYVFEKEPKTGGNSTKATSGINGWGTSAQLEAGLHDDERYFERDTFRSAIGGTTNLGMVKMLSTKSAVSVEWLTDTVGIPLTALSQLGGASQKRAHRAPPRPDGTPVPVGFAIMQKMKEYIATKLEDSVELKCGCTVTALTKTACGEEVTGVQYTDESGSHTMKADAVILATGGFGADHTPEGLLAEFRPDLIGSPTTNGMWTDGSGIRLGRALGANLIDMDQVQLHPTAFVDPKNLSSTTKFLGPEALRGSGGILLNTKGERFVNELDLRSVVTSAILNKCETHPEAKRPVCFCVLNKSMQETFGKPLLGFYGEKMGLFTTVGDVSGLAAHIGCDEATLRQTIRSYAASAKRQHCTATDKTVFPDVFCEDDTDLMVAMVTPAIHYCMGGLETSSSGEVQAPAVGSTFGKRRAVRRLFAAGECTGGMHGGNRLGGNSLLECVVMGRVCGARAGVINQKSPSCILSNKFVPLRLREQRLAGSSGHLYGHNTMVFRFNLHGSLQTTGLGIGQYIALRGEMDGEILNGFFSPITRPRDYGCIDILCRSDDKGGAVVSLLKQLRPGSTMHMRAMGGPGIDREGGVWKFRGKEVKRLNLVAGGTGIAPMIQILRAFTKEFADKSGEEYGLRLVYAAEEESDLAFADIIERASVQFPHLFRKYVTLANPPVGWTGGIGFLSKGDMNTHLTPQQDHQMCITCGPPIFEKFMTKYLLELGFEQSALFSYSNDAPPA